MSGTGFTEGTYVLKYKTIPFVVTGATTDTLLAATLGVSARSRLVGVQIVTSNGLNDTAVFKLKTNTAANFGFSFLTIVAKHPGAAASAPNVFNYFCGKEGTAGHDTLALAAGTAGVYGCLPMPMPITVFSADFNAAFSIAYDLDVVVNVGATVGGFLTFFYTEDQ